MATLEELRNQLDEIDNRMAELYQMRMDVCQQVGEYKVKAGRKVYDRQREKTNWQMWLQKCRENLIRRELKNCILN